jgi:hypothetical protein
MAVAGREGVTETGGPAGDWRQHAPRAGEAPSRREPLTTSAACRRVAQRGAL